MNPIQYWMFQPNGIVIPFPTSAFAPLVDQDIAAILTYLRANPNITSVANAVEHLQVEPGTLCPYVLVLDSGQVPYQTFAPITNVSYLDRQIIIRVISQDTTTQSAQTIARLLLTAIYNTLQGQTIVVDDYKYLNISQGSQEPTQWENVSEQVKYLHTGFKWLMVLAPTT